jgi:nitrous oxidase accessory protein
MTPTRPLRKRGAAAPVVVALLLLGSEPSHAASVVVEPGGDNLRRAITAARPGDILTLVAGLHRGPIRIDHSLTLQGNPGAVLDGAGSGRTIEIVGEDVTIRGLLIRHSGASDPMDAAVFLEESARGAIVEENEIQNSLVGIYVHGARDALVRGNRILGRTDLRMNERGNGIYVWNAPGAKIISNDISGGRDGIFTNASRNNVFRDNRIQDARFAIHYMYTNDSEVIDNRSRGNHAGYVIMYSDRVIVRGNVSQDDRDHGMLFNYANNAQIQNNVVRRSEKCVFIYNANKNVFQDNRFEDCAIGVHFTAGSERNQITGNAFVRNRTQVMYVGTRSLDWSRSGRGNYWSDNPAFDLNGDGIADTAYRPNDIIDKVVWTYPTAKLLISSPAVQVIRWAQSEFPALHPGGVLDSAPLMSPPSVSPVGQSQ